VLKIRNRKISWLVLVLVLVFVVTGCSSKSTPSGNSGSQAPKQLKVALLLPGPVNDNGWDSIAYQGLMQAQQQLGVKTAYQENVAQSDQEADFRSFAQQGYNLIIGHGDEFSDSAEAVAKDFPNTMFLVTSTDISQAPNVASMNVSNVDVGFIGGVAAALVTKTKKIGFIGGEPIAPITDAAGGFAKGAKYIDPSITVMDTNTGSFDDVAKAKETAKTFISKGADVVLGDADQAGLGVIQAAQEAGVLAIGYTTDESSVAPNTVIASALQNYPVGITYINKQMQEGNFQPKYYNLSVAEDTVGVAWNNALVSKLPAGAQDKMNQVIAGMKSGTLVPSNLP
jgi:basic membrane protein A